ncbi:GAF domain-containing protein [Bryobacter aggregatus]|uniref:GAF domain-containing protein n=1 Tax=Bryobacter aggregatus TaxID=360054 RepID=UPI000689724B|nr:GAF domain-containing protein [Bryobacter aggregatus]
MSKVKELERQLDLAQQQLRVFQKISRFMVKDLNLKQVLAGINALVLEFMRGDSCLLYLLDKGDLLLCSSNNPSPGTLGNLRLRLDEGLTGWVARERRLVAISKEAFTDPRFKGFAELPEDQYEAFLSAPIIARNKVVGVINVQHRKPHVFTGEEMETLTTVGEQVGVLLSLARLESGVTSEEVGALVAAAAS